MEQMYLHIENYKNIIQDTITIYHNLLLVVGNHGVGKTALLKGIESGACYLEQKRIHCALTMGNTRQEKERLLNMLWPSDWEIHLRVFIQEIASAQQRSFFNKIDNLLDFYLEEGIHQRLGMQRWISLRMIQKIALQHDLLLTIDEPELFLHPLLLRDVCAIIKELVQSNQVVVIASNSEQLVSSLLEDVQQIARLDAVEDTYKVTQLDVEQTIQSIQAFYQQDETLLCRFSNSNMVDEGLKKLVDVYVRHFLSSVMKQNIYRLLFSRCVILGEGSSEAVLFDYMEQVLHPAWTREHRVQYMSCLGKSTMPFYFIFLNQWGIRCICMHDYDNDTNAVHIAYRQAFERYAKMHPTMFERLSLQPDMEHMLHINPDYKLTSIEKPVNVYQHTFVLDDVKEKVQQLMDLMHAVCIEMEQEEVCR